MVRCIQVRALEWVQHNVEYFGGDPQRVTVMGHEAGAVSLGMLLLSPLCKGLLQQAVLLSGQCRARINRSHRYNVCMTNSSATKSYRLNLCIISYA